MDPASNTVSRITDVVPANFLCDSQTLSEVAQSKLADEKALSALEEELPALEARIQQLKAETATLEQLIVDKANEQTRLRSSIAMHTSLLSPSPIRSLPCEILSEIFLRYVAISQPATFDTFDDIVASHRIHTPILLVCRRWRTTALADPRLWTTIPLTVSNDGTHPLISGSPEQQIAYSQALERRIEATSTLPLNLLFHLSSVSNFSTSTYAISTFQTFLRLLPRADTISVCFSLREYLPIAIPELASMIDGAEIPLATHVHTARVFCLHEALFRKIMYAIPNVERLEIGTDFPSGLRFLDLPNPGCCLHSLRAPYAFMPLVDLLALLEHAPLLETLWVCSIKGPGIGNCRVVTHTRLSTFYLTVTALENDAIFEHLTLPALRSLFLSTRDDRQQWPRPSNITFLRRSGCMLIEVALHLLQIDDTLLMELLSLQKDLSFMQLNVFDLVGQGPLSMSILEFLSTIPEGALDRPVPALKVLTLAVLPGQLKRVRGLVQSRSGDQAQSDGIARLSRVDLRVQVKEKASEIERLEEAAMFEVFVSAGIDIGLSYRSRCVIRWNFGIVGR
ncbi:hypothetical protein BDZ89DRAFT_573871 [Hymenopellis radicata]|nr:hypothetical protein BDZ89DRAFT_573871 [Hymenopellis radicata]